MVSGSNNSREILKSTNTQGRGWSSHSCGTSLSLVTELIIKQMMESFSV